ncbi:MAG TPA: hypothetical protein VKE93_06560 [Candidatus Angelobacter sp.]|nr:hypothetical protein [Candidatus Angelobacter sp.]
MRILFVFLVLSLTAILLAVGALWWRLRWHLRRSDDALKKTLAEIQPEHETADAE